MGHIIWTIYSFLKRSRLKQKKILIMDRLDMLEFEKEAHGEIQSASVKIHKTFEFSTNQFIHKPLERFSKFSLSSVTNSNLTEIILKTFQVFDDSLILCSKPIITSDGFIIKIMSLDILYDKKTGYCHEINFPIFKMNQVVEYRKHSNRPA